MEGLISWGCWPQAFLLPDTWEETAQVATAVGLPVALLAGAIALVSYRTSRRAAGDAHMHGLFREFLIARLESDRSPNATETAFDGTSRGKWEKSVRGQLAGLKLYALEAMWEWVRTQERAWLMRAPFTLIRPWRTRLDMLASWRSTIIVHLNQESEEVLLSIRDYADCYSLSFLEFARDNSALGRRAVQSAIDRREKLRKGRVRKPRSQKTSS
jgi:hypothetical protein